MFGNYLAVSCSLFAYSCTYNFQQVLGSILLSSSVVFTVLPLVMYCSLLCLLYCLGDVWVFFISSCHVVMLLLKKLRAQTTEGLVKRRTELIATLHNVSREICTATPIHLSLSLSLSLPPSLPHTHTHTHNSWRTSTVN